MMKKEHVLIAFLVVYILTLLFFGVIKREPSDDNLVRLELFWGYLHPQYDSVKGGLLNIAAFIPIGMMVGLIVKKYKLGKPVPSGLIVSCVIEFRN